MEKRGKTFMTINEKLNSIIDTYWCDFHTKRNFAVNPSIPIIWFGNLKKYFNESKIRIVTVSINPSNNEFKDNTGRDPFWRFVGIDEEFSKKSNLCEKNKKKLVNAYNLYFNKNPYRSYFDYYEKVLKHFDCSYYGEGKSTAIHIDLYSPIATKNLWKDLSKEEKAEIQCLKNNYKISDLLLDFLDNLLKPDIILFSTQKNELKKVFGVNTKDPLQKRPLEKDGKQIKGFSMELYRRPNNNNQFILYGRNNYGKPFNLGEEFINSVIDVFKKEINKCQNY